MLSAQLPSSQERSPPQSSRRCLIIWTWYLLTRRRPPILSESLLRQIRRRASAKNVFVMSRVAAPIFGSSSAWGTKEPTQSIGKDGVTLPLLGSRSLQPREPATACSVAFLPRLPPEFRLCPNVVLSRENTHWRVLLTLG